MRLDPAEPWILCRPALNDRQVAISLEGARTSAYKSSGVSVKEADPGFRQP